MTPAFTDESSACIVAQVKRSNTDIQATWELMLEEPKDTPQDCTAIRKHQQYIRWLVETTPERGLEDSSAKKHSWAKARFSYDRKVKKLMVTEESLSSYTSGSL